jgi:hypothetical protein
MSFITPKFGIFSKEQLSPTSPKLDLRKPASRSKGFYFKFLDYIYLYEILNDVRSVTSENIDNLVSLVDIRKVGNYDDTGLGLRGSEFKIVEIIKIDDFYVLSELMEIYAVNVEYWAQYNLPRVFEDFYEYFLRYRSIDDEEDNFFGD